MDARFHTERDAGAEDTLGLLAGEHAALDERIAEDRELLLGELQITLKIHGF